MDEPLSNLDAKLRVEARSFLAKMHHEIGATTIYVTHDQSEAMTMGDTIVVMKDGDNSAVRVAARGIQRARQCFRRWIHWIAGHEFPRTIEGRLEVVDQEHELDSLSRIGCARHWINMETQSRAWRASGGATPGSA